MRILTDHCVPEDIVEALRAEGHQAVRLVDIADPRSPDRHVALLAIQTDAILVTADTDFGRRRDFEPRRFGGTVLLKDIAVARDRVVRRLLRLLANFRPGHLAGTVAVIDRRSTHHHR